jgi:preprotein translocase subunit SecD
MIGLGIGIVALVALACGGGWQLYRRLSKPDFERLGGTVLVYEVDSDAPSAEPLDVEALAVAVRRRLDPANVAGITVLPAGKNRVEVRIPRAGPDHAGQVRGAKELLAQSGTLEFRILANEVDDPDAIEAARRLLAEARVKPDLRAALEERARRGAPPPSPPPPAAKKAFPDGRTYTWYEVGPSQRQTLSLDNAAEKDPGRDELWKQAAEARDKGEPLTLPLGRCLLYSRACEDRRLSEHERADKKYEYFLLARDPDIDTATRQPKEITGRDLESLNSDQDARMQPAIRIRFTEQGGRRLSELTSQNGPSRDSGNPFYRYLAIILDGQITSAPRLTSAIGRDAQITGNFTQVEVDRLVAVLRAGSLPAPLKPVPVSEAEVVPAKR